MRAFHEWGSGDRVDMGDRKLIVRKTVVSDKDIDFPCVVVARSEYPDEGVVVFAGDRGKCETYIDEVIVDIEEDSRLELAVTKVE